MGGGGNNQLTSAARRRPTAAHDPRAWIDEWGTGNCIDEKRDAENLEDDNMRNWELQSQCEYGRCRFTG